MAVSPGRATTVLPSIVNRLSPAALSTSTAVTIPSISTSPWPMPLRRSSSSVTVDPETWMVIVISWLGLTSVKDRVPRVPSPLEKTSVNPPCGRPRSVKVPSAPTVVVMAGFSCTVTVTGVAVAAPERRTRLRDARAAGKRSDILPDGAIV
jgi:hypothetical protein